MPESGLSIPEVSAMSGDSIEPLFGSGELNWSTVGDPSGLGTAEYSGVPTCMGFVGDTMVVYEFEGVKDGEKRDLSGG